MSEESKTPKKSKLSAREAAAVGVITGVTCVLLPVAAAHFGQPLSDSFREMLQGGGVAMLLGGAWGARLMPTKSEESKP